MKGLTIYSSKFEGLLSKQTLSQILLKEAPRRWRSHKVQMFVVDRQSNSETEKQKEAKTLTENKWRFHLRQAKLYIILYFWTFVLSRNSRHTHYWISYKEVGVSIRARSKNVCGKVHRTLGSYVDYPCLWGFSCENPSTSGWVLRTLHKTSWHEFVQSMSNLYIILYTE